VRARRKSAPVTAERPFETDYAGAWHGRCKSRESAVNAASKHIQSDGYAKCTVTDLRTNYIVAEVFREGQYGFRVKLYGTPLMPVRRPNLRRVK
jgi:hypothetical protein